MGLRPSIWKGKKVFYPSLDSYSESKSNYFLDGYFLIDSAGILMGQLLEILSMRFFSVR